MCLTPPPERFPWDDLHKIFYISVTDSHVDWKSDIIVKKVQDRDNC